MITAGQMSKWYPKEPLASVSPRSSEGFQGTRSGVSFNRGFKITPATTPEASAPMLPTPKKMHFLYLLKVQYTILLPLFLLCQ